MIVETCLLSLSLSLSLFLCVCVSLSVLSCSLLHPPSCFLSLLSLRASKGFAIRLQGKMTDHTNGPTNGETLVAEESEEMVRYESGRGWWGFIRSKFIATLA